MPPSKIPDNPRRVLVADDEHLVVAGICNHLKALGMEVVGPFSDGQSALDSCGSQPPDLAILDIRMPVMDGLDAAQRLWDSRRIPSIIVSAYGDESYVERARKTGIFSFVIKPVNAEILRAAIGVAWSRFLDHHAECERVEQLELTIAQRRTIEQAKWKLVETKRMTEAEAHAYLQKSARNDRRRLIDVAEELLGIKKPG
ncbi:MAG TPA: response regulator [Phycisphaerales bacterium]|nr:response regulator [Phycisphaerales bacterium]